ncbi:trichohyalin-like [Ptychodera flava]|uniref:trichohyalin-like n=1 Tax=Ptychodera flava TaxID=63121 RepID=UPI003969C053
MASNQKRTERSTREYHRWTNGGATPQRSELSEDLRLNNMRENRLLEQKQKMFEKQQKMMLTQMMKEKLQMEEQFEEQEEEKMRKRMFSRDFSASARGLNGSPVLSPRKFPDIPKCRAESANGLVDSVQNTARENGGQFFRPTSLWSLHSSANFGHQQQHQSQRERRYSSHSMFTPRPDHSSDRSSKHNRVKTAPPHRNTRNLHSARDRGTSPERRPKSAFDRLTEHYMSKTGPTVQEVRSRLREQFNKPIEERWPDITEAMEKQKRALMLKYGGNTKRGSKSKSSTPTQSESCFQHSQDREKLEEDIRNLQDFDKEFANQMARIQGVDGKQDGTSRLLGRQEDENANYYTSKWRFEETRQLRLAETKEEQERHESKMRAFLLNLEETGYIPKRRRFEMNQENHVAYKETRFGEIGHM